MTGSVSPSNTHAGQPHKAGLTLRLGVLVTGLLLLVALAGLTAPVAATDASVSPAAANATNETTFVVSVDAPTINASDSVTAAELRERSNATAGPIADRLDELPGVTVAERFWIANVIIVNAEPAVTDPEAIAAVSNVTHVDVEPTVTTAATATDSESPPLDSSLTPPRGVADRSSAGGTSSTALSTPADAVTYGLDLHHVPAVWETYDTRGAGARVAVLDTGVDPAHPDIDLAADGWAEFDLIGAPVDSDPNDPNGHGTHVSGTVIGGNASGTAIGVAPDAELYHAKVFPEDERETTLSPILAGLQWAVDNDADVATFSLGTPGHTSEFINPIRNAQAAGTVVVSSSGNLGENSSTSPGNVFDGLSVGSVDAAGDVSGFSSGETVVTEEAWGSDAPPEWPDTYTVPDLTAAGQGVQSATPGGGYGERSGTSMAAPHVAGTVTLLRSIDDSLSPATISEVLRSTANHPDGAGTVDDRHGHGVFDAAAAAEDITTGNVTGTITDEDGTPIENVTVDASDTETTTDDAGEYELTLSTGNVTLNIEEFGFKNESVTVTIEPRESVTADVTLSRVADARVVTDQPAEADAGDEFSVGIDVANINDFRVTPTTNTSVPTADVSLIVDGEQVGIGDQVTFDQQRTGTLELNVSTVPESAGELALEHEFTGANNTTTSVLTGPTTITGDAGVFRIQNVSVPDSVERDTTEPVRATVVNVANTSDSTTVSYAVGNEVTNNTTVELSADAETEVVWNVSYTQAPGEYTQRVTTPNDLFEANLTIEGEMVVDDYRNEDGRITGQELREAIRDFAQGRSSGTTLRGVIRAFATR